MTNGQTYEHVSMKKKFQELYDSAKSSVKKQSEYYLVLTVVSVLLWVPLYDQFHDHFPTFESLLASAGLVAFLLLIFFLIKEYVTNKRDHLGG